jgi:hypothetical protein
MFGLLNRYYGIIIMNKRQKVRNHYETLALYESQDNKQKPDTKPLTQPIRIKYLTDTKEKAK